MRYTRITGPALAEYRISPNDSVQSAMERMNATGHTLLVAADDDDRLAGVLADGDVRRFLAGGGQRTSPVSHALNTSPVVLDDDADVEMISRSLGRNGVDGIPLVAEGRLVAVAVIESLVQFDDPKMTVVLMAGGLGTRLSPLTDDCPKPLLPVGGRPILTHVIDQLRDQNFRRLIISLNYLGNRIVDHYQEGEHWGVEIEYVHETQRLGTGGALALIDPNHLTDDFVVMNADLLHDIDLEAVQLIHRQRGWAATMVVRPYTFSLDYGVVEIGSDGEFSQIREKPTEERLINAGVYVLNKSVLPAVPGEEYFDLPTLFAHLTKAGHSCGTVRHDGRWIDIGTMQEYRRAQVIFADESGLQ